MRTYSEAAVSSLFEAALINAIDVVVAGVILLAFKVPFFEAFGLILLIEAAGLLLIGGAMGFAGQPGVRRAGKTLGMVFRSTLLRIGSGQNPGSEGERTEVVRSHDVRAALYMLAGLILFIESASLALAFANGA